MNIIYLHGFLSSALSIKGQQLKQYCQENTGHQVYLPDLNMHPEQALDKVSNLIESLQDVALVGSSLGGFYATQLVAKHGVPAVLINPAMRPWALFRSLFTEQQLPFNVTDNWQLDDSQLDHLAKIAVPFVQDADKILLLLQQGDEVLDYREAERYYSAAPNMSMTIVDMHGNHAMDDFSKKIPLLLEFLSYSIK
ncbi:YqiA/YcfP family alpha/beta fold hydrolase [Acinetobacter gerneri]|uniref:Esterase n=1 Tax=Acinetobacter gerneri DSM 14967 = CIP 107464 = MTCC 9824 TaxID=1120926 RepID=N8ZDP7_9GAMM|nr:YqiA/YcfP family alpha/beta fold hydrolase [Acinetobacter gerneri]ENV31839.1 hypothetical protein F960_04208 [Acinetobacter gerneri DSM 14967 = CIP 107464 = MTCC 9824]EPR82549.1 putative esterase [Acinetobacter gerneri DSM 14967 = CIP 107464 = MTCC 9824]MDV2438239.1 YqiA/YcfP family alpha/beta fold hydrolase [Acinetobacter gerneri]